MSLQQRNRKRQSNLTGDYNHSSHRGTTTVCKSKACLGASLALPCTSKVCVLSSFSFFLAATCTEHLAWDSINFFCVFFATIRIEHLAWDLNHLFLFSFATTRTERLAGACLSPYSSLLPLALDIWLGIRIIFPFFSLLLPHAPHGARVLIVGHLELPASIGQTVADFLQLQTHGGVLVTRKNMAAV